MKMRKNARQKTDKDGMYAQTAYIIQYEYLAEYSNPSEPKPIKELKVISARTGEIISSAKAGILNDMFPSRQTSEIARTCLLRREHFLCQEYYQKTRSIITNRIWSVISRRDK